jgi:serine/threonine protein kinase
MAERRIRVGRDTIVFDETSPVQKKRGKFSLVFTGRSLKTDGKVLVKRLRENAVSSFSPEKYDVLGRLRHPALQRVVGVAREPEAVFAVMRYTEGEDLLHTDPEAREG